MKAKIFLFSVLAFLIGVSLAIFFDLDAHLCLVLLFVLLISSLLSFRIRILSIMLLIFSFFFFGLYVFLLRNQIFIEKNLVYAERNNFQYTGIIDEIPVKNDYGYVVEIKLKNNDRILSYLPKNSTIKYNDIIQFSAKISTFKPEKRNYLIKEGFVGETYLKEYKVIGQNNKFSFKKVLYALRESFNSALAYSLPSPEASLASGLILGEKTLLTAEAKRLLQAAGVTHIIALSGYNITIILSLFRFMKRKFSRIINLLIPLIFIVFFVIMTGGSASIVRAGIMGFMPLLARYLFRPSNTIIAILFSAFLMVVLNPHILIYDVGFQLSFLALLGLTYISPIIKRFFKNESFFNEIFAETLGAQLAVLPLIIYYFDQFSVISPVSNVIILSLIPIGMLASFVIGVGGLITPIFGKFLAIPLFVILKTINVLIEFFGKLPFAAFQVKVDKFYWVIIMYLILINLWLIFKKGKARVLT